jgi:hypothetical protein
MVMGLLFWITLKIKNPARATTDNGATSIAMELVSYSNVDQISQVTA